MGNLVRPPSEFELRALFGRFSRVTRVEIFRERPWAFLVRFLVLMPFLAGVHHLNPFFVPLPCEAGTFIDSRSGYPSLFFTAVFSGVCFVARREFKTQLMEVS